MNYDGVELTADEKVTRWVLRRYREIPTHTSNPEGRHHLLACPDAAVKDVSARDSFYGCETGCEFARLKAVVFCPHGFSEEYEYGTFGEMADIIDQIG